MVSQRKYSPELRERATRMALEARADPETKVGAIGRIAQQLGAHREASRTWVRQAEIDAGRRPGTTTAVVQRITGVQRATFLPCRFRSAWILRAP